MGNTTPWGTPVVLVDAMPDIYDVGDGNEGFVVTGDLKRIKLYRKRGLTLEASNQATVTDADGGTVNLFAQDMSALRAVVRMVALCKFPEAFVITGTGTVS
jgi:HK97 family phage major capsid protein